MESLAYSTSLPYLKKCQWIWEAEGMHKNIQHEKVASWKKGDHFPSKQAQPNRTNCNGSEVEEWMCSLSIPKKHWLATEQVKIAGNYLQGLSIGKSDTYGPNRTGRLHPNRWKITVFSMSLSSHSFAILISSEPGCWHLTLPKASQKDLEGEAGSLYIFCLLHHLSWICRTKTKKSAAEGLKGQDWGVHSHAKTWAPGGNL